MSDMIPTQHESAVAVLREMEGEGAMSCPDDEQAGEDCGRWYDGKLNYQCLKAGSEECDWYCPICLPSRPRRKPRR